jgi:Gram-negative bacterial TonB protein C-terminal
VDSDAKASLLARLGSGSSSEPQAEESLKEPSESEARRSCAPGIKTNMVAREVPLAVTRVRAGKTAGEGELFTDEASSVLVHETGGVIQFSGAVVRGQLLLLANVESKREAVAQVKRIYSQKSRWVELEFAEPARRFWGMEFSAAAALLPKAAEDAAAAARILSEAGTDDAEPPALPTTDEVEAFKQEVKMLRGEPQASGKPLPPPPPLEKDFVPADFTAAELADLPKPSLDFGAMPLPKTKGLFRAKGKLAPGAKLRLAALVTALVVTVVGGAWFKHWGPWNSAARKGSNNAPAVGANVTTSPTARREAPREASKFNTPNARNEAPAVSPSTGTKINESPAQTVVSSGSKSTARASVKRTSPAAVASAKAGVRSPAQSGSTPIEAAAADGVVVPPKLIKSVKAVASLEDVRDFETGNVVIDAVVGTQGEVHLITVISGPPSLRGPAVEAVKQYRYEPATRNGQPVPEHVHITVRFRFES